MNSSHTRSASVGVRRQRNFCEVPLALAARGPAFLSTLAAVALSLTAMGQVPANLAAKKDFTAARASSTDPREHNGDSRSIEPGQTLTLMDVPGAGRVTHIWFTINSPSPDHLRELVLRMTWDDAARPAVECPVGDFFALGHGKYVEFTSAPVMIGAQRPELLLADALPEARTVDRRQ